MMNDLLKKGSALLVCMAVFAGCSSAPADTSKESQSTASSKVSEQTQSSTASSKTSEPANSTTAESAPDTLQQLADNAADDAKAEAIWMNLFKETAAAYNGRYEVEGDGEIYEYQTDSPAGNVGNEDHRLYETGRDNYSSVLSDGSILNADVLDLDDSYDKFISGAGVISKIDTSSKSAVLKLDNTENDQLSGTIQSVTDNVFTKDTFAENNIRDAVINGGFSRSVDPVHNSSLYSYDLQKSFDGYTLSLKVKDLDAFKEKAAAGGVLVKTLDERMVIGLDEITDDTFVFRFDKNGILKEAENNIFHAVYDNGQKTYVNVRVETDLDNIDDDADFETNVGNFMNQVGEGTLKAGDSFTITDWQ